MKNEDILLLLYFYNHLENKNKEKYEINMIDLKIKKNDEQTFQNAEIRVNH